MKNRSALPYALSQILPMPMDGTTLPHEAATYINSVLLVMVAYRMFVSDVIPTRKEHDELTKAVTAIGKRLDHFEEEISRLAKQQARASRKAETNPPTENSTKE